MRQYHLRPEPGPQILKELIHVVLSKQSNITSTNFMVITNRKLREDMKKNEKNNRLLTTSPNYFLLSSLCTNLSQNLNRTPKKRNKPGAPSTHTVLPLSSMVSRHLKSDDALALIVEREGFKTNALHSESSIDPRSRVKVGLGGL